MEQSHDDAIDAIDVTDVTDWETIRDEPGGRDANKRWVAQTAAAPRKDQWLWKPRTTTGDGRESALTDCAEVTVSRLARVLGLPAADCRYAVHAGELGLISRNVATSDLHEVNTGAVYLPEVPGYVRRPIGSKASGAAVGRMRAEDGYTLDAVEQVLRKVGPPPGVSGFTAFGVFAGYLVLDALVANGDRHPGNWALLQSAEGERSLAPTFDHGNALGSGLTEHNRRSKDPKAWVRRGKANPFTPRGQSLVDLALEAVRRSGTAEWVSRVSLLDSDTVAVALRAPTGRMSQAASTFIREVILENQRRLCDGHASQD